jgi:hypothetical protein
VAAAVTAAVALTACGAGYSGSGSDKLAANVISTAGSSIQPAAHAAPPAGKPIASAKTRLRATVTETAHQKPAVSHAPAGSGAASVSHKATSKPSSERSGAAQTRVRYIAPSGKHIRLPKAGTSPCTLVTAKQAAAALHQSQIQEVEGQLGPTCIFKSASSGHQLATLALEVVNVRKQLQLMKHLSANTVKGIRGYCGTIDVPVLLVPLTKTWTLHIQARCAQARAMAADTIKRLHT